MNKRYKGHGDKTVILLDDEYNVIGENDRHNSKAKWARIEVLSVQHTGTQFICKVLNDAGWMDLNVHHYGAPRAAGLVVSPIRDPFDTWVTWCSRDRKEDFFTAWRQFNEMYQSNPDLYIVPVDTLSRQMYLNLLASRLKCELKTDWEPVSSSDHKNFKLIDLTEIYELPVVKRYYFPRDAKCGTRYRVDHRFGELGAPDRGECSKATVIEIEAWRGLHKAR